MKKLRLPLIIVVMVLTAGLLASALSKPDPRQAIRAEFPELMPPGANMYLGFADLRGDLQRLEQSSLWSSYASGDNHEEFIRSRLWLRFQDRLAQLETLVGAPLDGAGFDRLAASTAALAFYEVGSIEFVYLARADAETELLAALGDMEGRFQERNHNGVDYIVARDDLLDMELAWVRHKGYLVVSDRERLLQGTLDRIAGDGLSLADEQGFKRIVEQLPADGDQLVYLNLAGLRDDGYFKTYWKQQDRRLLERHEAWGAALTWEEGRVTEHRFLAEEVPTDGVAPTAGDPLEALALFPADTLVAKTVTTADPAEAASLFLDGGRGEPADSFRTPLHDLLAEGDISRQEFDALVGDRFAVAVLGREYDDTFTLLDRVVVTRPTDPAEAREAMLQARDRMPARVTERLAGDARRPFAMEITEVDGAEVWSFDLVTSGIYSPVVAYKDGWLIQANSDEVAQRVLDTMDARKSLATTPAARELAEQVAEGPIRQALYIDLNRSRQVYDSILTAMERGGTFNSWDAQEFWTVRMRDLLQILGSVEGVTSWSANTTEGLKGQTCYRLEG